MITGLRLRYPPKPTGNWAETLEARRQAGLPGDGDLAALQQAGAGPDEIAILGKTYFHAATATFRGISNGFTTKDSIRDDSPLMAFWLLERLAEPQPVLTRLGVTAAALARHLVGHHPGSEWPKWPELAPVPAALLALCRPEGLAWEGPAPMPPMPWQPMALGESLLLENTVGPLAILEGLQWQGTLRLSGCRELGAISLEGGGSLVIEDCPGLEALAVTGRIMRVDVARCPDLTSIGLGDVGRWNSSWTDRTLSGQGHLPPSATPGEELSPEAFPELGEGLTLAACPRLLELRMGAGDLDLRDCPALTTLHKPQAGHLRVGRCPALRDLRIGAGQLQLWDCPSLLALNRREAGAIRLWGCANLTELRMGQGDLTLAGAPALERIIKSGNGHCQVRDCPSLKLLETQFAKHPEDGCRFQVSNCPELGAIRSQTAALRHCETWQVVDCPGVREPLPHVRVKATSLILGCAP